MRFHVPESSETSPMGFAPENHTEPSDSEGLPWEILIADDDPEVHRVTRLVLADFRFENRPLAIHSVYSGSETVAFVSNNSNTSVLLLDAVMEDDMAGLVAANRIRKELGNRNLRIILRTGQSGKTPENMAVDSYEINDYREKSDLSARKLHSVLTTALRNFRELTAIQTERDALHHILKATSPLSGHRAPSGFAHSVTDQLLHLLCPKKSGPRALRIRFSAMAPSGMSICKARRQMGDCPSVPALPLMARSATGKTIRIDIQSLPAPSEKEITMLRIFTVHIADVLDTLLEHQPDITDADSFSQLLSHAIAHTGPKENTGHLHRVGAFCHFLALRAGLGKDAAEELRRASPLHDIGKLAIPQKILNKNGPLTEEERAIVRTHPDIGFELLHTGGKPELHTAAIAAREHHERWDGNGYPLGLSGKDIHIAGRITAIADVFDALIHDRSYKKAWPLHHAVRFLKQKAGTLFDPHLVPCFTEDMASLTRIHSQWPNF
ncbi:HD domain-containing protein [Desulfobotulus sp. H1]|uniref:HD domain-containing protein n=1 Tax=Desulfobotulus pelophilus TaxID=2823377 RepID=A0ABT3N5C1_9BACT|nr:HD domain-containing phosphohydrolase [Desulfobotulus pelophilus]MCW7752663.1 HD domain-containing protein [Desulfobotulus pelophilus]